eukprot:TRINITY_DN5697_c0_g1_i1.p1 TRINITY_DN5697_c0_g1~~TRINITY_DN5697_c0_g1_i1.p1  ORF type:complete len:421 (-),score=99.92 TRINITY_DN5697_c0_g1_i1:143-1405(-)
MTTVKWFWAGDSKKGTQDTWIEYDADIAEKLEKAWNRKQKTVKIDKERYIDMEDRTTMLQRRYDDDSKRRSVKREETTTTVASSSSSSSSSKRKVDDDLLDDDDDKDVKWQWAGDSKTGSQDVWIDYDDDMTERLEKSYKKGLKTVKIDKDRYVDLNDPNEFLQRRSDDPNKRRLVRRESAATAKKAKGGSSGEINLVFSFDTTGSMMGALTEVRKKVSEIVTRLMNDLPNIRIGVITHGDYCDKKNLITYEDLTRDQRRLVDFINSAPSTSGGDAPEAYEYALVEAQGLSWSPGASSKTVVILGDAAPHPPAECFKQMKQFKIPKPRKIDWREEVNNLVGMGVKIHGVRCCGSVETFYTDIATMSGGKTVDLSDFDKVCDTLLAMCFREGGGTLFEDYRKEVTMAGRMDAGLSRVFDTL